jgi:steroid delta-isomerase-like uncharacterized protein
MTRDDAKRTLERHRDALNRHDVGALCGLYAETAVLESPLFGTIRGRRAIGDSFIRLFDLFPDYAITMRDPLFLWEGTRAAEFSTVTGTQRTALFGLPPSRQAIEYHAARLFTFRDGLIEHEQRIYDFGGVLERLEKARTDRELATASAVQRLLMARADLTGDFFEVARASFPCRTIGGDFLEFHDLQPLSLGVALGDVSGKGAPAALVAAMLHGMMTMATDGFATPEILLHRLNVGLCRRQIDERYATVCYATLTFDGRLAYSNAGHPPPLLVAGGDVRPLAAGGPILGVFEDATFPSETLQLSPGDSVILYSDGVTEAPSSSGEDFGMSRLVEAAGTLAGASAPDLVAGLLASVNEFTAGTTSIDDATIAVLQYRPR